MKRLPFYLMTLSMGAVPARARGEDASQPKTDVVYEKKTKIDFEDRDVDGEFATPDGQSVNAEKNLHFDSMLDPKKDFKKELKRSMGAVR